MANEPVKGGSKAVVGLCLVTALILALGSCMNQVAWFGRPQAATDAEGGRWLLVREITPAHVDSPRYRLLRYASGDKPRWYDAGRYLGAAVAMVPGYAPRSPRGLPPPVEALESGIREGEASIEADSPKDGIVRTEPPAPATAEDVPPDDRSEAPRVPGFWLVMEDGAAVFHDGKDGSWLVAPSLPGMRFWCADADGDGLFALASERSGGELRLYRHDAEAFPADARGWSVVGGPLSVMGSAATVKVLGTPEGGILAFWRAAASEGMADPAIGAARFDGRNWTRLPFVPSMSAEASSSFAPLLVDGRAAVLVEGAGESDPEGGARLALWSFDAQRREWERSGGAILPLSDAGERQRMGLSVAPLPGGGWWVARADAEGVSAFVWGGRPDAAGGTDGWRRLEPMGDVEAGAGAVGVPGGVIAQPFGRFSLWIAAVWAILMIAFLGGTWGVFRWLERWAPSRRLPGALATPLDRGLAFMIDAAVTAPFPVAFLAASSERFWASPAPSLTGYWLWLGALSVYAAVTETVWGKTLGKHVMGLRVRSSLGGRGGRILPWQAWSRNLLRLADFWPWTFGGAFFMPYLTALVWVLFTPGRRRMGDWAGQTLVRRHVPPKTRRWILASASPRRMELLTAYGLEPQAMATDVDERMIVGATLEETAMRRAERKLWAAEERLRGRGPGTGDEIVVAGDTVVGLESRLFDKPADEAEAVDMLGRLSGNTHRVVTGVAMLDRATGQFLIAAEVTEVDFRELSEWDILGYARSGEGMDKAGGYGIQGAGRSLVASWRGSYSNVIGMPMELFDRMVDELDG